MVSQALSPDQLNLVQFEIGGIQPGDTNVDGRVDMSDPVRVARILFVEPGLSLPCDGGVEGSANRAVMDWNQDGTTNISDVVGPLQWLFRDGTPHGLGSDCRKIARCTDACEE